MVNTRLIGIKKVDVEVVTNYTKAEVNRYCLSLENLEKELYEHRPTFDYIKKIEVSYKTIAQTYLALYITFPETTCGLKEWKLENCNRTIKAIMEHLSEIFKAKELKRLGEV